MRARARLLNARVLLGATIAAISTCDSSVADRGSTWSRRSNRAAGRRRGHPANGWCSRAWPSSADFLSNNRLPSNRILLS